MFLKHAVAVAVLSLSVLAAPVAGQMLPDITGMDLNALNDQFNAQQNGQMNAMTGQMIQQNLADPQARAVMASGACGYGSPEQLAYIYGATGGCTQQGFGQFNQTTEDIIAREREHSDSLYGN